MITASCIGKLGRLGNTLFQIAAVIGYSRKHKIDYFIPEWPLSKHFKYGFNQSNSAHGYPLHRENGFHYQEIPKRKDLDIYGYWQSIRYWEHCQRDIRALFSPNDSIQALLDKNPLPPNTCAIHVRRTDYLQLKDYHPSLPIDYYQRAMEAMKADKYIVFSDDIEYCKQEPTFTGCEFVNSGNDLLDFFMATQCDKFILANSSFSWWFSYLSNKPDKKMIAPARERWFGTKYNQNNVDDLYLDQWQVI